ncbi:MAG: DUF86 domain-containing protein [Nitrospirae bacterium]|nr:DUF86 domain-containing protein [Nitrospirota bacterium]
MPDINRERVEQYLAEIKESLTVLRDITTKSDVEGFVVDSIKVRAVKYTIVIMVEAICNLFRHILAKKFHVVVEEYMEAVIKSREKGILSRNISERLIPLTKLRHQLIHGYWKTDDRRLFEETRDNLDIIESFLTEIILFLESPQKEGDSHSG